MGHNGGKQEPDPTMPHTADTSRRAAAAYPASRTPTRTSLLLLALLATACAPLPPVTERPLPPAVPEADYAAARARGEAVYRIDADQSLVTVRVHRGGRLARLGHDHVVASRAVEGLVLLARTPAGARADLQMALDSLSVDEPGLRAAAGLGTTPSAADIDGTRRNMLDKTLDAARFPYVTLALTHAGGELPQLTLNAAITLHGITRTQPVPVEIESGDDGLRARGRFALLQTDYGITPFSVLGGALEVQDRLDIDFDLRARRW
jgi:hypothetical protein